MERESGAVRSFRVFPQGIAALGIHDQGSTAGETGRISCLCLEL
jgi:hypothetical protein